MSQRALVKPVEMTRADAIAKFGTRYTQMEVPKGGGFAGTNTVTFQNLIKGSGDQELPNVKGFIALPETLSLPLETDVGQTVYVLRRAKYKNGNYKRSKQGVQKWEVVTDTVKAPLHLDPVPQHLQDKGNPYTHTITWETEQGARLVTPSEDPLVAASRAHLGEYAKYAGPSRSYHHNQYVFTSLEDVRKFIESVEREPANDKASLGLWAGMRRNFDAAVWNPEGEPTFAHQLEELRIA